MPATAGAAPRAISDPVSGAMVTGDSLAKLPVPAIIAKADANDASFKETDGSHWWFAPLLFQEAATPPTAATTQERAASEPTQK